MKNDKELIIAFFALYIGQKVAVIEGELTELKSPYEVDCIELESFDNVSREDAIEIVKTDNPYPFLKENSGSFNVSFCLDSNDRPCLSIRKFESSFSKSFCMDAGLLTASQADKARALGYAVNFRGHEVDEFVHDGFLRFKQVMKNGN